MPDPSQQQPAVINMIIHLYGIALSTVECINYRCKYCRGIQRELQNKNRVLTIIYIPLMDMPSVKTSQLI